MKVSLPLILTLAFYPWDAIAQSGLLKDLEDAEAFETLERAVDAATPGAGGATSAGVADLKALVEKLEKKLYPPCDGAKFLMAFDAGSSGTSFKVYSDKKVGDGKGCSLPPADKFPLKKETGGNHWGWEGTDPIGDKKLTCAKGKLCPTLAKVGKFKGSTDPDGKHMGFTEWVKAPVAVASAAVAKTFSSAFVACTAGCRIVKADKEDEKAGRKTPKQADEFNYGVLQQVWKESTELKDIALPETFTRTLPGTDEAYAEMVAAEGKQAITTGGASAQLSIKLTTDVLVDKFKQEVILPLKAMNAAAKVAGMDGLTCGTEESVTDFVTTKKFAGTTYGLVSWLSGNRDGNAVCKSEGVPPLELVGERWTVALEGLKQVDSLFKDGKWLEQNLDCAQLNEDEKTSLAIKFQGFQFHLMGGQDQVFGSFEDVPIAAGHERGKGHTIDADENGYFIDPNYGLFKDRLTDRGFGIWSRRLLDDAGWTLRHAYNLDEEPLKTAPPLVQNCAACWATHIDKTKRHHFCSANSIHADVEASITTLYESCMTKCTEADTESKVTCQPKCETPYASSTLERAEEERGSAFNKKSKSQQLAGKGGKEKVKDADLIKTEKVELRYSFLAERCSLCVAEYFKWDPQFQLVSAFVQNNAESKIFYAGAQVYGHFDRGMDSQSWAKKDEKTGFTKDEFKDSGDENVLTRNLAQVNKVIVDGSVAKAKRGALDLYGPCIANQEAYGGNDYGGHWGLVYTAGFRHGLLPTGEGVTVKLMKDNDIDVLKGVATQVMCKAKGQDITEKAPSDANCDVYKISTPIEEVEN